MSRAPRDRLGTASALIATIRQVGLSLGMALAGALFSARRAFHKTGLIETGQDPARAGLLSLSPAFHDVLLISMVVGAFVALLSLLTGRKR